MNVYDWWVCNCCGEGAPEPEPYYGQGPFDIYPGYGGYYHDQPRGPCDCCGGDNAMIVFTGAVNPPHPARHGVFNCSQCGSQVLQYTDLIGKSMGLSLCSATPCDNSNPSGNHLKVFHGCEGFPIKSYSTERLFTGSDCPDRMVTVYLYLELTCRRFPDGRRGVALHGGVDRVKTGGSGCLQQSCADFHPSCTAAPFESPEDYESSLRVGTLSQGESWLSNLNKGCGTSSGVSAHPGAFQYGVTSATVVF